MDEENGVEMIKEAYKRKEGENAVEYLKRLENSGEFVFHGSPNRDIAVMEPRPATDTSGDSFKNDTAVFADARSAYAILRALIPSRDKVSGDWTLSTGMRKGIPEIQASEDIARMFGTERGMVYVMPKKDFEESKDLVQWKSKNPEKPFYKVEVGIEDYKSVGGKIEVVR